MRGFSAERPAAGLRTARRIALFVFLSLTLHPAAMEASAQAQEPASSVVAVRRLPGNPMITPETDASIGTNINGPSLIRVPAWIPHPLGRYYLYFADHNGKYIRLAYANRLEGPWKVYAPGTLQLSQSFFTDHIASPEAIVDDAAHKIRLYYHGLTPEERTQHTRLALSADGIHFTAAREPIGKSSAYWRLFRYGEWWYALAMPGRLLRSRDGLSAFEPGPSLFSGSPSQVHNAVLVRGDTLYVFYTRAGDTPERILLSRVRLGLDWTQWKPGTTEECLAPETKWEGADLPMTAGRIGALDKPVRALRDPAVFQEAGKTYLVYAIVGESGLAIAELSLSARP